MKLKIDAIEKIQKALDEANGKADKHTFSKCDDLIELVERADDIIFEKLLFTQKHAVGVKIHATSGDAVARSYKYPRVATSVTIERCPTGWFVTDIRPDTIWQSGGSFDIIVPSRYQDEITNRIFSERDVTFK
jgi:hypothetical protein